MDNLNLGNCKEGVNQERYKLLGEVCVHHTTITKELKIEIMYLFGPNVLDCVRYKSGRHHVGRWLVSGILNGQLTESHLIHFYTQSQINQMFSSEDKAIFSRSLKSPYELPFDVRQRSQPDFNPQGQFYATLQSIETCLKRVSRANDMNKCRKKSKIATVEAITDDIAHAGDAHDNNDNDEIVDGGDDALENVDVVDAHEDDDDYDVTAAENVEKGVQHALFRNNQSNNEDEDDGDDDGNQNLSAESSVPGNQSISEAEDGNQSKSENDGDGGDDAHENVDVVDAHEDDDDHDETGAENVEKGVQHALFRNNQSNNEDEDDGDDDGNQNLSAESIVPDNHFSSENEDDGDGVPSSGLSGLSLTANKAVTRQIVTRSSGVRNEGCYKESSSNDKNKKRKNVHLEQVANIYLSTSFVLYIILVFFISPFEFYFRLRRMSSLQMRNRVHWKLTISIRFLIFPFQHLSFLYYFCFFYFTIRILF
jgi:hypothetical protein